MTDRSRIIRSGSDKAGRRIIFLLGCSFALIPLGAAPVINAPVMVLQLGLIGLTARKTAKFFGEAGPDWRAYVTESRLVFWLSLFTMLFWIWLGWLEYRVFLEWMRDTDIQTIAKNHSGSGYFWICYIWTLLFGTYLAFRALEIRTVISVISAGFSEALNFRRSWLPWMGVLALAGTLLLLFGLLIFAGTMLALQNR